MRRREFIVTLSGAAATWPLAARAQQPAMPVIGFISSESPDSFAHFVRAFHEGLSESGYVESRNVAIEYRWARGQLDLLPLLAADLVKRQVNVILASGGSVSAPVAKAATRTIPIVFIMAADPVGLGLVASLNRPGGNVTGVNLLSAELMTKQLDLLHELAPQTRTIALLVNPASPYTELEIKDAQYAAHARGRQLQVLRASSDDELETAFMMLVQQRAEALLIAFNPFFTSHRNQIVQLAARSGIPAVYPAREFATAGGLMSYGGSVTDAYRQAGVYTGKILKGAKPEELPVTQPTKFELVVNLKAARALGLAIPDKLLAVADEVIE
jgi:putative tryptophan/tyrosine transport system substrate-binding protein